jgi:predicted DCC family thiol-disulfide oxidoreductase YuxK
VFAIPTNRSIRYIPLQSESGRKLLQRSGRSPDDISSVVLVEKDRWPTISFLQEL